MRGDDRTIIAKKYASAFLNLYLEQFSAMDIEQLGILERFLKKNRFFYVSLDIPGISKETKFLAIDKIAENFQFKKPVVVLMKKLLEHGRIEMLHRVLRQIRFEYTKRTNIKFFKVISSHALTTQEKKVIVKLIQTLSESTIRTNFVVDPESLIVGIRIESPSFLWERSIRKELMKVGQAIIKEGIQC